MTPRRVLLIPHSNVKEDPRVRHQIAAGTYDRIVFEDYHFLPLLTRRKIFTPLALKRQIHLDMFEYQDPRLKITSVRRLSTDRCYRWKHAFIGHSAIDTRTTVASRITELYVDDFGVKLPKIVRDTPPEDLTPPEARSR